jgi:radical SAM protein with 4Fe4S-binding SPASM domain
MLLQIFTSLRCNLRCKYCYSPNRSKINSIDNVKQALLHLKSNNYFDNVKKLELEFIGGEPLLHPSLIKDFILLTKDFVKEHSLPIHIFKVRFISNFTLYHKNNDIKKLFKWILSNNIRIGLSVSIDGTKQINDNQRIYPTGKGSYNNIIKSLEQVNKDFAKEINDTRLSIGIRATVPDYWNDIIDLAKEMSKYSHMIIAEPIDYLNFWDKQKFCKEWIYNINKFVSVLFLFNYKFHRGMTLYDDKFTDRNQWYLFTSRKLRDMRSLLKLYPCQGCFLPNKEFVSIGFSGVITACNRVTAHQYDNPPFITDDKIKEIDHIHLKKNKICNGCEWRPFCNSSCLMTHYEHNKTWEETLTQSCYFTKAIMLEKILVSYFKINKKEDKYNVTIN